MRMMKSILGWVLPLALVIALLAVMSNFKRVETLTKEEKEKIALYTGKGK